MDEKDKMDYDPLMPDMQIPKPDLPDDFFAEDTQETEPAVEKSDDIFEKEPGEIAPEPVPEPEPLPKPEIEQVVESLMRLSDDEAEVVSEGKIPTQGGYQYQSPPAGNREDYSSFNTWQNDRPQHPEKEQYQGVQYNNKHSSVLGVLSIIFGIISLVFFCSCFNIITGIAAIIFGIIQLAVGEGVARGISITGIVTGAISIILFFVFWGAVFGNSNIGESVLEQYGDGDFDEFLEDYMDRYDEDIEDAPVTDGDSATQV